MLDLWNECERCHSKRGAPFEACLCEIDLVGFKRRTYLCDECRKHMANAWKAAMKLSGREDDAS